MVQRISLCNQAFWADTHKYNYKDTKSQWSRGFLYVTRHTWLTNIYNQKDTEPVRWIQIWIRKFPYVYLYCNTSSINVADENIMQKKLLRCNYLLNFDDKIMHMIRMHVMPFVIRMYVWYVSVCFFGVLRYLSLIAILTTTGDQITHLALVQRPIL